MTLTIAVLLVLLLFVVQLFLQETTLYRFDLWRIMGNRDARPEQSVVSARLERAKNNMMEALPLFLGLAMLALVKGINSGEVATGATVFLIARVVYIPAYASGIPVLRSLVWVTGMIGLFIMALPLL